jgi:hypothetical protein
MQVTVKFVYVVLIRIKVEEVSEETIFCSIFYLTFASGEKLYSASFQGELNVGQVPTSDMLYLEVFFDHSC